MCACAPQQHAATAHARTCVHASSRWLTLHAAQSRHTITLANCSVNTLSSGGCPLPDRMNVVRISCSVCRTAMRVMRCFMYRHPPYVHQCRRLGVVSMCTRIGRGNAAAHRTAPHFRCNEWRFTSVAMLLPSPSAAHSVRVGRDVRIVRWQWQCDRSCSFCAPKRDFLGGACMI